MANIIGSMEAEQNQKTFICPRCGKHVVGRQDYCPRCGQHIVYEKDGVIYNAMGDVITLSKDGKHIKKITPNKFRPR